MVFFAIYLYQLINMVKMTIFFLYQQKQLVLILKD